MKHFPRPLLVRVEPRTDENLLSLVSRAAVANVIGHTAQLFALAGIKTHNPAYVPFLNEECAASISRLLSVPLEFIRSRMHPKVVRPDMPDAVDWFGTPLPRKFIDAKARHFSKSALGILDFHPAVWKIKPISFCSITGELLRSRCRCGHKLGWVAARGLSRCESCLETLGQDSPEFLSSDIRASCIAAAALVSPDGDVRQQALKQLPSPFCDWEAGDVFAAIVELGVTSDELMPKTGKALSRKLGRGDFSEFRPGHLAWGYRFASNWPDSLDSILAREAPAAARDGKEVLYALGKFFSVFARKTPLRDLLRERLSHSGLDFACRNRLRVARGPNLISTTQVSKKFKLCKKTLRRLSEKGRCFVSKSSHNATLYDSHLLTASVELLRSSVKADECSRILGVPIWTVDALIDVGLLESVTDHDALLMASQTIVLRRSIERIVTALRDLSAPDDEQGQAIHICQALMHRFDPTEWARVVSGLVSGNLPVSRYEPRRSNVLNGVFVARHEIDAFLALRPEREPPSHVYLSCVSAGKLLGVPDAAIAHAMRIGLLSGRKLGRWPEVLLPDLKAFHRTYVMTAEGARAIGVTPNHFTWKMREFGSKPAIKLYRLPVWRRDEAEAVFKRIIVSSLKPTALS